MAARWVRFEHRGRSGFGTLHGDLIQVCIGDMFGACEPTEAVLPLASARLLMPVAPGKVLALWNNFHALGDKLGLAAPAEPLYFIKASNACIGPEQPIRRPACGGKVVYEGELGIVIGRACRNVPSERALEHIFGYTCANDVTLTDILHRDPSFPQWVRAKGFDTFCPLGPVITSGLDPQSLRVRTLLDGVLRQDYPISDMRFPVEELVSLISRDMTLFPGDVILCGTSLGVGAMKSGSRVEIEIAGIGRLGNPFE
jgi:2-keto-4-pentenoate hydratase/2-oxohepta-3-ene-1,7-dioic acid hydratase in catechol pathway